MTNGLGTNGVVGFVAVVALVVAAFAAGAATRPWLDRLGRRLRMLGDRRHAVQRDELEQLIGLLPDLQKAGEASRDAAAYRRCLDLNLQVIASRDRLTSRRIRNRVEQFQDELMRLSDLSRAEADREGASSDSEEASGEEALKRVYVLLKARQDAWEALAQALSSISGELRRLT